jgi:phage shock protein PspC (stress-responsive transcriptional regulator)
LTCIDTVRDDGGVDGRQLVRSRVNRRVAGVCGGIGEYFALDPTLIRVGFVVATFLGLAGIVIYIVLWIVMPEAPVGSEAPQTPTGFSGSSPAIRIAEDRFARGEITAQELQQIRDDLSGRS